MQINILNNKKIGILGTGITGFETAIALEEYKNNIIIITNNLKEDNCLKLEERNYIVKEEKEIINSNNQIDILLKSPGVPFDNAVLKKYEKSLIINDIELAYLYIKENMKTKIVAVTGTNGKTSTVLLIEKILRAAGFQVRSAGNIATSPLHVLQENNDLDFIVLEVSSFQLKNIDKFKPDYSFLLNINADHLDMHKTLEDYINAKKRIYKNQSKEDFFFVKKHVYKKFLKDEEIKSKIIFNEISKEVQTKIKTNIDINLNTNNIYLLYQFCIILKIDPKILLNILSNPIILEHRMELVKVINGVTYYNDSKATNLMALKHGLKQLDHIILLVGGSSKNEDLSDFSTYLINVKLVIAYGENRNEYISNKVKYRVQDLEEAVFYAKQNAIVGDNIILSPAAASFDQYTNYKERGKHFKKIVGKI